MLIELAGPAGAGKSTLLAALRARDAAILPDVVIRPQQYLPAAIGLAPAFMKFHCPFRGLFRKEMKRALYLTTLHRVVTDRRHRTGGCRIFDEGPVYLLARMLHLAEDRFENEALRRWWELAAWQWARTLHLVVFLDADSRALTRRIRSRASRPPVSDTRDVTLIPFLDRYRQCYQQVLHAMTAERGGPAIVRVDTGAIPLDRVADGILAMLGVPCP